MRIIRLVMKGFPKIVQAIFTQVDDPFPGPAKAVRRLGGVATLLGAAVFALAAAAAPARVVSTNLCTDQLAMLIAAPGQLVSVSAVARDPVSSAMAREAAAYPVNHGAAEEIFLLSPDLVLGGEFMRPDTRATLERLGLRVETLPIETSFAQSRANILRIGALLGREDRAAALAAEMDAGLEGERDGELGGAQEGERDGEREAPPPGARPRAALLYSGGYTSGAGTLADEILQRAGLDNIAARDGAQGLTRLPLERLAMEAPDLLVLGQNYGKPALAQEILRHPAVRALGADRAAIADNLWVCGLPQRGAAVARLRAWVEARRP